MEDVFLPAGYPSSVSPDYFHYQVFNGLQALCSSLAGLISSRAVLEGFGVGNASASATQAMLLTILQDAISRLSTIAAAYYLGTSLFPECKTYRLLADILNDCAIIIDSLSPLIPLHYAKVRAAGLCISGSLRALCGICAGGSKTALTFHFVRGGGGAAGDVGDLNAKDGSRETVVGLLGMLIGTFLLQHSSSPTSTYIALFVLIAGHIVSNYLGVRSVAMSTLNRQRASIAWQAFRHSQSEREASVPSIEQVAAQERIFAFPDEIRDIDTGASIGQCSIGKSFHSTVLSLDAASGRKDDVISSKVLEQFSKEKFILWPADVTRQSSLSRQRQHVFLKRGHTPMDHLKGWVLAIETSSTPGSVDDALKLLNEIFPTFIELMKVKGWDIEEGLVLSGSMTTLVMAEIPIDKKLV
ncbi:hypothetical protein JAAARDRAFT_126263 [Jaapia argillacea MUCL 33604]|uniref:Protein root UVB sensitive/RUS domain-containing protein n=1 Tax=Jaapia argillacea MUCL 33604 TaxID=933084 RepID=A0A067PYU4_9AGAM|nr:hypothetical protein JAAARDRAFT_126263 [Jaapia argillacea MUCL 33604]